MIVSKRYATGLALIVIAVCSHGPLWLDLIALAIGAWMTLTDKEEGRD